MEKEEDQILAMEMAMAMAMDMDMAMVEVKLLQQATIFYPRLLLITTILVVMIMETFDCGGLQQG